MGKDPAILFYTSDFLTGSAHMTDAEAGQYIKLLCLQHQRGGYLEAETVKRICDNNPIILEKFIQEDGKIYNKRMLDEIQKRRSFSESRRKNAQGPRILKHSDGTLNELNNNKLTKKASAKHMLSTSKASGKHMENENIDINKDKNKEGSVRGEPKDLKLHKIALDSLEKKKSPLVESAQVRDALLQFISYRIRAWGSPYTELAAKQTAGNLVKHSRNNPKIAERILLRSIEMGWKGIFELDPKEMQAHQAANQVSKGPEASGSSKVNNPPPEGFGKPSPTAISREEYLRQKAKKEQTGSQEAGNGANLTPKGGSGPNIPPEGKGSKRSGKGPQRLSNLLGNG